MDYWCPLLAFEPEIPSSYENKKTPDNYLSSVFRISLFDIAPVFIRFFVYPANLLCG